MDSNIKLEDVAVESDSFHILEENKSKFSVVDQNQDFESMRETVDDNISLSADSEARSTTGSGSETDMFLTDGSISIEELYEYDIDQNIRRSISWSELNETSGWQDDLPSIELVDKLTHRFQISSKRERVEVLSRVIPSMTRDERSTFLEGFLQDDMADFNSIQLLQNFISPVNPESLRENISRADKYREEYE
ncbi:hypothetical protein SARC_13741, partial [Sphaeroforma arctica JP610]